jgi:hypothetical protein
MGAIKSMKEWHPIPLLVFGPTMGITKWSHNTYNGFRVLGYHNKNPKVLRFLPNIVNM